MANTETAMSIFSMAFLGETPILSDALITGLATY